MKTMTALLAAGAALAVSAPAMAQEAGTPAEAFAGPRVEAIIGYDHNRSGSTKDIDTNADIKQSIDGLLYGAGIGYDAALGTNLTAGVEAEVTGSTAKWDNNNGVPNTFNLGRVKAGRDLYVGGRVGYAMSPATLVYLKGGYTNARYNLLGTDGTVSQSQRLDTDGWRVGAGVEQKFGDNMYGKIEYRYSKYGKGEYDYNGNTPDSSRFSLDTDRHQVVVGVGMRF
jgi:outer membrane immunogenic protein